MAEKKRQVTMSGEGGDDRAAGTAENDDERHRREEADRRAKRIVRCKRHDICFV